MINDIYNTYFPKFVLVAVVMTYVIICIISETTGTVAKMVTKETVWQRIYVLQAKKSHEGLDQVLPLDGR